MKATMRAVRLQTPGDPEMLELQDMPLPQPGAGQVRVRAHTIGVGRPDCMVRRGTYKWMPALPCTPGNEMSGTIDALGPGVSQVRVGQPVLVSARELVERGGCYAQFIVVPADALIALPDDIDLGLAASLPNYQVAWALLHRAADVGRVGRVYCNGAAGGVGTAIVHICQELGVEVVAGASTPGKRAFVLAQGATHAIDTSRADVAAQVLEQTAGRGVDLVLDHLGGPAMPTLLDLLAPFGTIVSYNLLAGLPTTDLFKAMRERIGVAPAVRCFNMHSFDHDRIARRALLDTPLQWLRQGRVRPAIHARLPMEQVQTAHHWMEQRVVMGKLVLDAFA